jgi:hypothetical protein
MATRSIMRSISATLGLGGTVDVVQFSLPCSTVRIYNQGGTALYVRVDGVDPTTDGSDGSFLVEPNSSKLFAIPNVTSPEIRLVSSLLNLSYRIECAS